MRRGEERELFGNTLRSRSRKLRARNVHRAAEPHVSIFLLLLLRWFPMSGSHQGGCLTSPCCGSSTMILHALLVQDVSWSWPSPRCPSDWFKNGHVNPQGQ